ncbi:MAG: enoyl-CoA hydratase/isomerase family protein [Leptospiraceae bacterium]|nr:enoyl-CoA hydratase/isomerase family protein [Leptospiraceae bacterium]
MSASENFKTNFEDRRNGKIAIVELNLLQPNNTFNLPLLQEFLKLMEELTVSADAILVTSAHAKFFSNGLDGKSLLEADTETRLKTINLMTRAYSRLIALQKPWLVEITGYAMAGGAVISSAADYRFMLAGSGRIGFSEMMVGLPLPMSYIHGLHRIVHPSSVRYLIEGNAYKPEDALGIGLLDGVAESSEKLRSMCLKKIDALLRFEQESFLATRNAYRRMIIRDIAEDEEDDLKMSAELVKQPVFERALRNIAGKNA